MPSSNHENPTVFSTEFGRMCPRCGKPVAGCICKKNRSTESTLRRDQVVRLFVDRKGRAGKSVTIVDGLRFPDEEIKNIAKILKKQCGCGGSIKDGKIEIQGDVRDEILPTLQKMGLVVKKAGG